MTLLLDEPTFTVEQVTAIVHDLEHEASLLLGDPDGYYSVSCTIESRVGDYGAEFIEARFDMESENFRGSAEKNQRLLSRLVSLATQRGIDIGTVHDTYVLYFRQRVA